MLEMAAGSTVGLVPRAAAVIVEAFALLDIEAAPDLLDCYVNTPMACAIALRLSQR